MSSRGMSAYYYVKPPQQPMMGYEDLASPGVALHRILRQQRAMSAFSENGDVIPSNGNGDVIPKDGNGKDSGAYMSLGVGVVVAIVAAAVAINYQIGKAMAPDRASTSSWAWQWRSWASRCLLYGFS